MRNLDHLIWFFCLFAFLGGGGEGTKFLTSEKFFKENRPILTHFKIKNLAFGSMREIAAHKSKNFNREFVQLK